MFRKLGTFQMLVHRSIVASRVYMRDRPRTYYPHPSPAEAFRGCSKPKSSGTSKKLLLSSTTQPPNSQLSQDFQILPNFVETLKKSHWFFRVLSCSQSDPGRRKSQKFSKILKFSKTTILRKKETLSQKFSQVHFPTKQSSSSTKRPTNSPPSHPWPPSLSSDPTLPITTPFPLAASFLSCSLLPCPPHLPLSLSLYLSLPSSLCLPLYLSPVFLLYFSIPCLSSFSVSLCIIPLYLPFSLYMYLSFSPLYLFPLTLASLVPLISLSFPSLFLPYPSLLLPCLFHICFPCLSHLISLFLVSVGPIVHLISFLFSWSFVCSISSSQFPPFLFFMFHIILLSLFFHPCCISHSFFNYTSLTHPPHLSYAFRFSRSSDCTRISFPYPCPSLLTMFTHFLVRLFHPSFLVQLFSFSSLPSFP